MTFCIQLNGNNYGLVAYKVVASESVQGITLVQHSGDYTFKSARGLCDLGIKSTQLQRIQDQIKVHRKKQEIKIVSIKKDADYVHIEIEVTVMGETVSTTLTNFHPLIDTEQQELVEQIEQMEAEGMTWAKLSKLYPERHEGILADTFCAGLVHVCYPEKMTLKGKPIEGGFSTEQLAALDKWMRALFANDEERDDFSLVETAHEVRADNMSILSGLDTKDGTFSPKIEMMRAILQTSPSPKITPEFFLTSLGKYLDSTATEATFQETLTWPETTVLNAIKGVSSGSYHAIDAGATMLGLDASNLTKSSYLQFIANFSATSVESHNDVLSHSKEVRQRLSKLHQILINVDIHYEQIEPYLDCPQSTVDDINDKNLQYLVRFSRKLKETAKVISIDSLKDDEALFKLLNIIPSFNHIDVDIYQHKISLQEAYNKASERGNSAIKAMKQQIDLFHTSITEETIHYPTVYRKDESTKAVYLAQAAKWVNICRGWGSQVLWALVTKRYNQGLESSKTAGSRLVDICRSST